MVIRGPCARKSRNFDEAKEGLPKPAVSGLGTSPIKPVLSPQALMRKIPPPSKGVRLLDPLRWYYVAGAGKRDKKSTFPLLLPLRYSRV